MFEQHEGVTDCHCVKRITLNLYLQTPAVSQKSVFSSCH